MMRMPLRLPCSVDPCRNPLIDPLYQPRERGFSAVEDDVVLQYMIQVDVHAAIAIENGDRAAAIDI